MIYQVTHTTQYRYGGAVSQCQSELRLTPRSLPWQRLIESRITTEPAPTSMASRTDYFGNVVTLVTILGAHDRFTTMATSLVEVEAPAPAPSAVSWEQVRDDLATYDGPRPLDAHECVFESPFVPCAPELADYARASFPAGRAAVDAAADLSRRIHADFEYAPSATHIHTPLVETLRTRRGVCQDFAHLMIGALRSMGLAARYVSGYLRSGVHHQGAEASHAWVSVYMSGAGWVDFDPTNAVRPTDRHVTVAWGRDYGDVTPVKGVALGGGRQQVTVTVRVEPAPGEEATPPEGSEPA